MGQLRRSVSQYEVSGLVGRVAEAMDAEVGYKEDIVGIGLEVVENMGAASPVQE